MTRDHTSKAFHRPILQAGAVSTLTPLDTAGARFRLDQGGQSVVVSSQLIGEYRLAPHRQLTEAEAESLSVAAAQLAVFDKAVWLLGVKGRSARDLGRALRQRGATPGEVQSALQRLQELGLLDDSAFARGTAQARAGARGSSRRRVEQLLVRKGVNPALAKAAAAEAFVGVDEREAAREVAARRLKSLASLDGTTQRRRLYAWLARRGYPPAIVSAVVRELCGGGAADAED
jgi:regulatory protein